MIKKKYKDLEMLEFNNINSFHGFTTRSGGASKDGYESLSFGMYATDLIENVQQNFEIFFDSLNIEKNKTVATHQTHSDNIEIIDNVDEFKIHEDTDGFITNKKGITLMTFYADCTPLFFCDSTAGIVGIAHSGWKGTELKIGVKMVKMMKEKFGCKLENINVGIGPNISKKAYLVNCDFLNEFSDKEFFGKYLKKIDGKCYFDMVNSNKDMLLDAGILENNIELSNHCTYLEPELFFSFRRQGVNSGRMAGFIRLGA